MRNILVATDFSDVSKNAVKYAASLSEYLGATLHLLNVYESTLYYTAEMPYTAVESAEKLAREEAEKKMEHLKASISKSFPGLSLETEIKRGVSAESITDFADHINADLVVAGATGAGVVERTLIGSTTTAIINKSKKLVLIVPEGIKFEGVSKIVYATDLHDDNIQAANDLALFARPLNAEIVFLLVDNKIRTDSEELSEEMSERIHKHVKYPKISGYVCTDPLVTNGIDLFVKKSNAEMVCMLTHHRKFPRMLWDKSLTTKFAYHTHVPLLVMHAAEV
ncbi:MAG TPA: universal stress protein [Bacteroidia bacterium]|nr:universal stress protein [Bacteroidia bacterium]